MATIETSSTHEVLNQPPPLEGYNVFDQNRPLVEALRREGAEAFEERARELGERAGTPEALERGRLANENPPILRTHDRFGNRIDEVEFHPAWHELLHLAVASGIHALPWREPVPGAQAGRAAMMLAMSGVESGTGCPLSMTYAGVPALRAQPEVAEEWEPRLTSLEYDPRFVPVEEKRGALMGMAMTERQGGSDVRANTTVARPLNGGGPGAEYEINGHKWFCSAPMCDAFLVLAQADGGLSCFLLPRWTPDGERNGFHIQRLKDKLGNRSNASSEVEFDDAWARLVGEEGRGVPTIIEMVNYTRLDCVLGSAGLMRAAVAQATHHTAHREVFGKLLIDQPLMRNVLADLCIESEAATLLMVRLARAFDHRDSDERERAFCRIATAMAKYWLSKRAPVHVAEALECLGCNGYVEESIMPRLYREAPLYSIWEGSGNVMCLDVLRALTKDPATVEALLAELQTTAGADQRLDGYVERIGARLATAAGDKYGARDLTEKLALALQASLMVRYSTPAMAAAFISSRLAGQHGQAFGTLPEEMDVKEILNAVVEPLAMGK